MKFAITEHVTRSPRHTTSYIACGPQDGTPIIFVHGWPELAISWRHQLPAFAALGFRAIAPDMRGYGRSSNYPEHADYALEHSVTDMIELLDHLGTERAVWVGHDWGAPVVWSIASHHPDRCHGVANLCVPYISNGFAPVNFFPLIDREVYPPAEYPAGQWDYMLYYQESFAKACATMQADVTATVKALFRKGNPAGRKQPSRTSTTRRDGGWFGGAAKCPDFPRDADVLTEVDLAAYVAALTRTGFAGPDAWYMNHDRNVAFAAHARNAGRLSMPVLFLHGAYDYTCETMESRLAEPMRQDCSDLTEVVVRSGHWMAQEQPVAVNAALVKWLAGKFPELWRE